MPAFLLDIADLWTRNVSIDLRRYVIFAVSVWGLLWIALRIPLRARKIRERVKKRLEDRSPGSLDGTPLTRKPPE